MSVRQCVSGFRSEPEVESVRQCILPEVGSVRQCISVSGFRFVPEIVSVRRFISVSGFRSVPEVGSVGRCISGFRFCTGSLVGKTFLLAARLLFEGLLARVRHGETWRPRPQEQ